MHRGDWNDRMGDGWGTASWILMAVMMTVFWGGVVWLVVTAIRHRPHDALAHTAAGPTAPLPPARPTAQEMLAERLARGEIEVEDYRNRLDALAHQPDR